MFPTPIQKYSIPVNILYRVALIVTLFIWLMPLIAVMLTSIRTYDDILAGNYWGWPKDIAAIENYSAIYEDGRMARYFLNSITCINLYQLKYVFVSLDTLRVLWYHPAKFLTGMYH